MPNVRLTDRFGLDLDVPPNPSSAFARYFRSLTRFRFSELDAGALRDTSLANLPLHALAAGLTVEAPVEVGAGGVDWVVGAGAGARLALEEPGRLGLSIAATLSTGLGGRLGDLSFGLRAGGAVAVTCSQPFALTTPFGTALRSVVENYRIPGDVADLETMEEGTIATVAGRGSLKFAGSVNLVTAVNPLAMVSLPLPQGVPQVKTGGAVEVGATFELSSEYEVRAERLAGGRVRLGWRRKQGSEFEVRVTAKAGVLGGTGGGAGALAGQVLGGLLAQPGSGDFLRDTGLGPPEIERLEAAVRAAVERNLELAVGFELGALRSRQAAFLYEIDLAALETTGRRAVEQALRGDLSGWDDEDALPAGIRMVESIFTSIRRKRHGFRINLLGIYNFRSVRELARESALLCDSDSGDLVWTDTVTARKIESERLNIGADSRKLRKLLAESFLITAAWRASRLAAQAPELESTHSYFELKEQTKLRDLKDNLDVAQALGLLTAAEKQEKLRGIEEPGRTTFLAETGYNEERTTRLFLNEPGQPREEAEYERAGREALQLLVQADDPQAFRRRPAIDDELWRRMKSLGQANFRDVFPSEQLGALIADYTLIVWWARTMRRTGEKLAEVRRFFAENPAPAPDDPRLEKLRRELGKHLESVAADTHEQFGDPWGLVAMDRVSGGRATARVVVTGPHLALRLERRVDQNANRPVDVAGGGSGGVRGTGDAEPREKSRGAGGEAGG